MILVAIAMAEEAKLIIENETPNIKVIMTGVGKVNAAMEIAKAIETNEVEEIYNFGFAGATDAYQVGDVVVVKEARYHDFDLTAFGFEKGQVPGYPARFQTDSHLLEKITKGIEQIKVETLYTGDYFMVSKQKGSFLVDMEGAALYQVAFARQIPIISIKVVSDVLGMDKHIASYRNFEAKKGAKVLNEWFLKLIKGV
jgi:adenosylhomocysteine nucleosidase